MAPLLVLLLCTPLVTCYVLDLHNSLSLVITVDPDPVTGQCTVKHHTDIINFACMTWNFVRILASLSALCTNINQICHWHCISFYPILM